MTARVASVGATITFSRATDSARLVSEATAALCALPSRAVLAKSRAVDKVPARVRPRTTAFATKGSLVATATNVSVAEKRSTDGTGCELFLLVFATVGECPKGKAWFDLPIADDVAHQLVECSNAGVCDRLKGDCICNSGFTGSACNRSELP